MISTKRSLSPNSSNQIETLRKRLDAWRKTHKPRSRIPTQLWDCAARVAGQCGLNRTAKALHLDYPTDRVSAGPACGRGTALQQPARSVPLPSVQAAGWRTPEVSYIYPRPADCLHGLVFRPASSRAEGSVHRMVRRSPAQKHSLSCIQHAFPYFPLCSD
jgi:hypothetical protein